jgi:MFS family permease
MLASDAISMAVYASVPVAAWCGMLTRRSGDRAAGGVLDGLRFAWRDPYLRAMTAFASLANLALTGIDALLVVFLVRTLGLSSATAGLVMASLGIGGVLGALAARPMARRFGTARAMLMTVPGGLWFALLLPLADKGPRLLFAGIALMCTSRVRDDACRRAAGRRPRHRAGGQGGAVDTHCPVWRVWAHVPAESLAAPA